MASIDDMIGPAPTSTEPDGPATAAFSSSPKLTKDDLMIPRLRLAQGLTAEVTEGDAKPGHWVLTGFDSEPDVVVVPMQMARTRALIVPEGDGLKLACYSGDAVHGVGSPGGTCEDCPLSKWTPSLTGGKNNPPSCNFGYEYVAFSVTHQQLITLTFRKTAQAGGRMINTFGESRGWGNFAVKLSSQQQKNGNRTWFVPVVSYTKLPDSDVLETAKALLAPAPF